MVPSSVPRESGADHIPRLDVLRAAAILLVFFFHYYSMGPGSGWLPWNGLVRDYSQWPIYSLPFLPVMWGGLLGVPLFFVLSGFCIHLSFLRRPDRFTVKDFYWRRFLRIYPAYFVCLVACVLLTQWMPYKYEVWYQVPIHMFLIHNLVKMTFSGINGVFWSLGVEAQFYLFYPLLLLARKKWGLQACLIASVALNVLCQLHNALTRHTIESPISSVWSMPLLTWCNWILGACLAEAYVEKRRFFQRGALIFVLSLFLFVLAQSFKHQLVESYFFAAVLCAVLMDRYLAWKAPVSRFERFLIPIGLVSYSLYLWHVPVIRLSYDLINYEKWPQTFWMGHFVYLPVIMVLNVPVVLLSYYYMEQTFPRWLKKVVAERKAKTAPVLKTTSSE
jgi:peptidoglycan/LPS O-acetylase OafA/YrhL